MPFICIPENQSIDSKKQSFAIWNQSRLLFCSFAIDPRQPNDFSACCTIAWDAAVVIELGAIAGVEIVAAVVVFELEAITGVEIAAAAVVVELGATERLQEKMGLSWSN